MCAKVNPKSVRVTAVTWPRASPQAFPHSLPQRWTSSKSYTKKKTTSLNLHAGRSGFNTPPAKPWSNEILLGDNTKLTYFTEGETLRPQMKQIICFCVQSHTNRFPSTSLLIERVLNDISPGQLLNMVCFTYTHARTYKMHANKKQTVLSLSAYSLCPTPTCAL